LLDARRTPTSNIPVNSVEFSYRVVFAFDRWTTPTPQTIIFSNHRPLKLQLLSLRSPTRSSTVLTGMTAEPLEFLLPPLGFPPLSSSLLTRRVR